MRKEFSWTVGWCEGKRRGEKGNKGGREGKMERMRLGWS